MRPARTAERFRAIRSQPVMEAGIAAGRLARPIARWAARRYLDAARYFCFRVEAEEAKRRTDEERRTRFSWIDHEWMCADRKRLGAYREDIAALVAGRRVLEIGPGPAAPLTRACLEAGAESVYSVEGNPWAAARARTTLRSRFPETRWRLIPKRTSEVSAADFESRLDFDVLLFEVYDTIACREGVVETVADLRRLGIRFSHAISRGFESYVAPAGAPPSQGLGRLERMLGGWRPGRFEAARFDTRSVVLGDPGVAAAMALCERSRWQRMDFERDAAATTEHELGFDLPPGRRLDGLLFTNRLLFHRGVIDTLRDVTHWGAYFLPLAFDGEPPDGGALTLRFEVPDPARPSEFAVLALHGGGASRRACFG